MMQEVGSDSNGEGAYDFVADAKKDAPVSGSSSSSAPFPQQTPVHTHSTPVYAPPLSNPAPNPGSQKPTYEFPPGMQGTASLPAPLGSGSNRPLSAGPVGTSHLRNASLSSNLQSQFNANPGGPDLSDFMNALPTVVKPGMAVAKPGSAGPDLNEIFGPDVMSKLPPLNSQKPPLPTGLTGLGPATAAASVVAPSSSFTGSLPPSIPPISTPQPSLSSTLPSNLPPPPAGLTTGLPVGSSVNPFSSQAAGGKHLPSFSGLPPLPAHLQGGSAAGGGGNVSLQGAGMGPLSGSGAPPPVQMMSVTANSQQALPGMPPLVPPPSMPSAAFAPPAFAPPLLPPGPFPSAALDTGFCPVPPPPIPASGTPYGPASTGVSIGYGMPHDHQHHSDHQHHHHSGVTSSQSAGGYGMGAISNLSKSWLAQTSFDTIKSVTEKAKSAAASIMTTLDPQMKQYSAGSISGAPGSTEQLGKEMTVFYIGNETNNMMDAIKMGFEGVYRTCYVYTRSGTAANHKMQTSFISALQTATATVNLARNAPQLGTSLLLAVEPFVVELTQGEWYVSSCVALSVPGGALLHVFTQLSLLPQGLISSLAADGLLPLPLDQLITRAVPNTSVDSWMEPLLGVSWGATVALAVRQLAANYRRRF